MAIPILVCSLECLIACQVRFQVLTVTLRLMSNIHQTVSFIINAYYCNWTSWLIVTSRHT